MADPALGALSTVVIDLENPGGWAANASKATGVNSITVSAGTAYTPTNGIAQFAFSGGTPTRPASAYITIAAGIPQPATVVITDSGAGYGSAPTATLPGGSGATITPVMGTLTTPKQIAVLTNTLTPAQELVANSTLRGDFNAADPFNGKKAASGQISFIPNQQMAQFFLKALVGGQKNTITAGGGPYTHTNKLSDVNPLSFIAESAFNIGGTLKYQKAIGCRINQLTIPIDSTGGTPWTVDVMASDVQSNSSPYYASPTDWRALGVPMDFTQLAAADVKIGGSSVAYVKKGSIQISANLAGDDYRVGGAATRGSLVPNGSAQISGSLTLVLDNAAVLTLITAGTASSLSLKWTMGAGSVEIDLDRIFIQKTGPVIKDGGPVEVDVQFRAAYDTGNATSLRTIVINDQAGPIYT